MDECRRITQRELGGDAVARPATVLLVENEPHLQSALRACLILQPDFRLAAVCAAKSEALQVIETTLLDIVLVSLNLADGSGLDVVRAARQCQPPCTVLVMGTIDDKDGIFSSMQAGASACLLKENVVRAERGGRNPIVNSVAFSRILGKLPALSAPLDREEVRMTELSSVQEDILRCVAGGLSNKEIARNLLMSSYNVDYHLRCLRRRFSVCNRAQLVRAALNFFQN
jgi:DNA-binding NarL/FixJ family response regulator